MKKSLNTLLFACFLCLYSCAPIHKNTGKQESLRDIRAVWEQAIIYHRQGLEDIEAIELTWMRKPLEATPGIIARIFAAVYADTYWVQTRMSPEILSNHMQIATQLDRKVCDQAAAAAFSQWCGILVRESLLDTGIIPKKGNTTSPDIISNGNVMLTVEQLLKFWNELFGDTAFLGKNYCYTRCANLGFLGTIKAGKVRMFYSDAGFNIPPTSWHIMYTEDNRIYLPLEGMTGGSFSVGNRAASGPFLFETYASTANYSCITVVSTEFFQNDPLTFPGGNWKTYEWLTHNGAVGWHNVTLNSSDDTVLKFYNQDVTPERFVFEIIFDKVPVGTLVSLECRESKVPIQFAEAVEATRKYSLVSREIVLPGSFTSELLVQIEVPGSDILPAESSVDIRMVWIIEHGHNHYLQAADLFGAQKAARNSQKIRVPMGSFTFKKSGTVRFNDQKL